MSLRDSLETQRMLVQGGEGGKRASAFSKRKEIADADRLRKSTIFEQSGKWGRQTDKGTDGGGGQAEGVRRGRKISLTAISTGAS